MILPWTKVVIAASALFLSACQEEAPPAEQRVRAIKPFTVTAPATGITRRYAGEIAAAQTSELSFATSGTVETIEVVAGETVTAGQMLAALDPTPFELDVQSARAELSSAEANYAEARVEQDRKSELFRKGWVAKAALDSAVAAAETARGSVEIARSQLGQAQRTLEKAQILAPFDGVISNRLIEPFVEVAAGTPVFQINASAGLEIDFAVPDAVIDRLTFGQRVDVRVPTVSGCGCAGRIIEIGSAAGAANTVEVSATIDSGVDALLPGMAAEVQVTLADGAGEAGAGFLVPLSAIAPGTDGAGGFVFKYDASSGVVRQTPIRGGEGQDNMIAIREGVAPGDVIAIAGVSFLRDGQRVTLLGN